jgi:hypothetical protein
VHLADAPYVSEAGRLDAHAMRVRRTLEALKEAEAQ